jgi:hypothetical protein
MSRPVLVVSGQSPLLMKFVRAAEQSPMEFAATVGVLHSV